MLSARSLWQGRARPAALAIALTGVVAFAGCDVSEDSDLERGRALFNSKCNTCHALAEAGATANVGPNLDASFAAARADGMDNDTIEGVVQNQIDNPREVNLAPDDPNYTKVYMPADIVTGQDAEDVAAYVASVAGVPGAKAPELPPDQLFTDSCGGCHALSAAGTSGTTGPNLDDSLAGKPTSYIEKAIVDPNSQLAQGYPPNVMPQDYGQQLTPEDLKGLVEYLFTSTSGAKGGG